MAEVSILSVKYKIQSAGPNDANLTVNVDITKEGEAFSGFTEDQMIEFVRNYLQSLTLNPVSITKIETVQTSGL